MILTTDRMLLPVPETSLDLTAYRRPGTDDLIIVINDARSTERLSCLMRIIVEAVCAPDPVASMLDCHIRFEPAE